MSEQQQQQRPPFDAGEILFVATRGQDRKQRIRLSRKTYEGKEYLDLRVDFFSASGWLPTAKGVSIRRSEIAGIIDALSKVPT